MEFIARIAKILNELNRMSMRYKDENLKILINELLKQLTITIIILNKILYIYNELDMLAKTALRIDPLTFIDVELKDREKLADLIARLREAGQDVDNLLAYLMASGRIKLEVVDGEIYAVLAQRY